MTTRTTTCKGLDKPHKALAPKIGDQRPSNAKSIATEKSPKTPGSRGGLPSTYYGNSHACGTERGHK